MTDPNVPIHIEFTINGDQSALLEGLDDWLRLGLLSDRQVRQMAQRYLTCPLPESPRSVSTPTPATDFILEEPLPPPRSRRSGSSSSSQPPESPRIPAPAGFLASRLQSLMAEISVIWLLFLGVFMVVVSSGVLAATQWQRFTPVGQYLVLWAYTLAFWGVSRWTARKPTLTLTSAMVQVATLLIIPINFWMMDELVLWRDPLGGAIALLSTLSLTAILIQLLKPHLQPYADPRPVGIHSIALSWLHWGWGWSWVPLLATYIGTLGTAAVLVYQNSYPALAPRESGNSERSPGRSPTLPLPTITLSMATLLLIARAVVMAEVPLPQLGLAVGICGWLIAWLSRLNPSRAPWGKAGWGLLIAGWLMGVSVANPWQAIAVSGLAAWLLLDRLARFYQPQDLSTLFLVGLQAYGLLWWVVPGSIRQQLLEISTGLVGSTAMPLALVGIGGFPYVLFALWGVHRFRQQDHPELAIHGEILVLLLGAVLAGISAPNPGARCLNLLLSVITLGIVVRRRSHSPPWLIYLTHGIGLAAIASWIDWGFPSLPRTDWAVLLLIGMVAEWGLSVMVPAPLWQSSAWYLGLVLSGVSYGLLLGGSVVNESERGWFWLITPISLTMLVYGRSFPRQTQAAWLSTVALLLVQPLTFLVALPRLLTLGVATGLMVLNTRRVEALEAAILTVGFGLGFAGVSLVEGLGDRLTIAWVLNSLAIAVLLLWLLRGGLRRYDNKLSQLYGQATNGWAIALVGLTFLLLSVYNLLVPSEPEFAMAGSISASALLTLAIAYRIWQQPTNLGFLGLAWGVELTVASSLNLLGKPWEEVSLLAAVINLALALGTQLAGDWWVNRVRQPYPVSWHGIPLLYASLGLVFAHPSFTPTTGLYTLTFAAVGLGIGRRQPDFRLLTYLSLFAISGAAYELLIYQLLQAEGGESGDGLVLLAGLAGILAIAYRLTQRWVASYLRLIPDEVRAIAHIHWIASSAVLLLALGSSRSLTGEYLWTAVALVLSVYALIEGRLQDNWIYAGVVSTILTLSYFLYLVVPDPELLRRWAGAIACPFAMAMHRLPWSSWGWSPKPWQRCAALLPGVILLLTWYEATIPVFLIVAAFYTWLAKVRDQVRLSYVSVGLADWAILRWLVESRVQEPLWYAALLGLSLLYGAQVDPQLQSSTEREKRHWLRCLAVGLISLTAIYQAETSLLTALLTIALGIALILAGLMLKVRAFLYIGTATFILQILRQLWRFISLYPILLWAIGILLGLVFIWIAATFEARRSQVGSLVESWAQELDEWE